MAGNATRQGGGREGHAERYQAAWTPTMRRGARGAFALAAAMLPSGCGDCGSNPYTPYKLGDAPSAAAPDAAVAPPPPEGPAIASAAPFAPASGTPARGEGKAWTVEGEGTTFEAPAGRRFDVGLTIDADGDGKRDLLAWTRAPDGLRGELWFAPAAAPDAGQVVAAMPPDLAARGCTTTTAMTQIGPRTVALDLSVRCPERGEGRPSRWIALVRLAELHGARGRAPDLRLELRIAPPPAEEALAVTLDGSDRDGDGRDDVTATFTLTGALAPFKPSLPVSAIVRFFDRPAGLSRDAAEPEASLRARAVALAAEARKKSAAAAVAGGAVALESLWRAICEEGGAPLVTTSAGPLRCGETPSMEQATFARGVAALTLGDPSLALSARTKLEVLAPSSGRAKELGKLFAKQVPGVSASARHRAQAAPSGSAAGVSPLAFENAGSLLVRTADGVVRVDATSFAEGPAELPPWPDELASRAAPGRDEAPIVLRAVTQRCDEPTLSAEVAPLGADPLATPARVRLPLLTPVAPSGFAAARCEPLARVRVTALDASPGHLVLAIGGHAVALDLTGASPSAAPATLGGAAQDRLLGAARSPDGATVALPAPQGVLVRSGASAKLWTSADLEKSWGCTPSNGGDRLACVTGGAAVIYEPK